MRIKLISVFCMTVLAMTFGSRTYAQVASESDLAPDPVCPADTLFEPYTGVCATVNDITHLFGPTASLTLDIPNLEDLRDSDAMKKGFAGEAGTPVLARLPGSGLNAPDDAPVPGGYGAGTTYLLGTHQTLERAVFHTKMFIQPEGVDSIASDWWLYTPATNHTDSATEFVGIYASHLEGGWFGIFGRPCTEAYPCPDGDTSNGWQAGWTRPFSDFECNTKEIADQGGHDQKVMHYANETVKLDQEDPPLWQNSIYVWNYCMDEWDLFWRHQYRESKRDCSVEGCYKWGPILETFGTQDEINELGYEDSLLFHDGRWSFLSPDETDFVLPISPWLLLHHDPNRGYGVGNRYVLASLGVTIDIKPRNKHNKIRPQSRGYIWVAVLSDSEFDPLQVDISTVRFGPEGATANRHRVRDVNRDGLADLLLRFKIRDTGIACGDTEATLTGEAYDGQSLSGTDSIKTVCGR